MLLSGGTHVGNDDRLLLLTPWMVVSCNLFLLDGNFPQPGVSVTLYLAILFLSPEFGYLSKLRWWLLFGFADVSLLVHFVFTCCCSCFGFAEVLLLVHLVLTCCYLMVIPCSGNFGFFPVCQTFYCFGAEEKSRSSEPEFSEQEVDLISRMYNLVGERWSLIAGRIPGRTAEEIEKYWKLKNYCNSSSS
ncbi:hypothetical protein M5K25_002959 [Dendrobium thyrsiflorum]|uniref:Myb-like domain-containing protein n=1 Tax=Dendrobium thyrsiflorum TaxID=117978 RepID=A0ABD0VNS8_DENTH